MHDGRRGERLAAVLAAGAGFLHLWAGPAHVEQWWAYGLFFFGAAAAQFMLALVLWTRGIEGWGGWMAVRHRVYLVGLLGTLAVVALWALSRTVGIPFGPEAFDPEGLGVLDLGSKAFELALVGALLRLWLATQIEGSAKVPLEGGVGP